MSHGGHGGHHGHGGHSGHSGHHHHGGLHGGHPDSSAIWNSAMQGGDVYPKKGWLSKLPNPSIIPVIIAFFIFLVMLLPFVIDISQSAISR